MKLFDIDLFEMLNQDGSISPSPQITDYEAVMRDLGIGTLETMLVLFILESGGNIKTYMDAAEDGEKETGLKKLGKKEFRVKGLFDYWKNNPKAYDAIAFNEWVEHRIHTPTDRIVMTRKLEVVGDVIIISDANFSRVAQKVFGQMPDVNFFGIDFSGFKTKIDVENFDFSKFSGGLAKSPSFFGMLKIHKLFLGGRKRFHEILGYLKDNFSSATYVGEVVFDETLLKGIYDYFSPLGKEKAMGRCTQIIKLLLNLSNNPNTDQLKELTKSSDTGVVKVAEILLILFDGYDYSESMIETVLDEQDFFNQ